MNEHSDWKKSRFMKGGEIDPIHWKPHSTIEDIINNLGKTC